MLPNVFLSLSGVDADFVKSVEEFLPDGIAHFYPKTFSNGENLVAAMEARVADSEVFVLFASRKSLDSVWVGFEIDRARLAKIKNPNFKILVFITDPEVSASDLPEWMREFWADSAGLSPRDVARFIRSVISEPPFSQRHGKTYGRGALLDAISRDHEDIVYKVGESPNVFVFAGNAGIGRRTVEREYFRQTFSTLPLINFGPSFPLAQFADLADLYRALRQELDVGFTPDQFTHDLVIFSDMSIEQQAAEVVRNLSYFAKLGQSITFVTGNGIYEDRGTLKAWVPHLFRALETDRRVKLAFVSNRTIHDNELRDHPNVLQVSVPSVQERDIRALMIATAGEFGAEAQLPNDTVIKAIGGHPGIAKTVASTLARKGPAVVNNDLQGLYKLQEEILADSLTYDALTEFEKDILSILSWIPQINGNLLKDIIAKQGGATNQGFADTLDNLMRGCLVMNLGENYAISEPMRGLFRRKHGYGSSQIQKSFAAELRSRWDEAVQNQKLRTELFDAIVYMAALEGGTLAPEFRGLLLASTLQEVVRDTYNRGHEDEAAFRQAVSWGALAKTMRMDETTREEILSYYVRAQTRLGDQDALETLKFIDSRGYRSRYYLRSFYVRHSGGDLEQAIALLNEARKAKKYMDRVIADLALCYQRLGRWRELADLLKEEDRRVEGDPQLLDLKIGMLISQGDFRAAERAIETLRGLPREGGRADARTARIWMQRDGRAGDAQRLLTRTLQSGGSGQLSLRRLRAIAAAQAGDEDTARRDVDFLKGRPGGADTALRIESHIALSKGAYELAHKRLAEVKISTVQDHLLRARILETQANDVATPLAQAKLLRDEAARLRAQYRLADEYFLDV
ncbi:TIR domain-containing protein [Caulobacter sp. LARHSG274]